MYLPKLVLIACMILNVAFLYASARGKKKQRRKDVLRIQNLERTIQKLKRANGKLWYDMRKKEHTESYELSELTRTNL
jgi:hypothetical protein